MPANRRPLLIGITGTIGSGKSTVCHWLEHHYNVIYTDQLAHQVLSSPNVLSILTDRWGNEILQGGEPNRAAIAKLVFSDPAELSFLNNLLHPLVLQIMQQRVEASTQGVLCFEVPLLFENRLEACFDFVILIVADTAASIERLIKRDKSTAESIVQRIRQQMPAQVKQFLADFVLENNGSLEDLQQAYYPLLCQIPALAQKSVQPFYPLVSTKIE
jgi:dephospho-CoA kinase